MRIHNQNKCGLAINCIQQASGDNLYSDAAFIEEITWLKTGLNLWSEGEKLHSPIFIRLLREVSKKVGSDISAREVFRLEVRSDAITPNASIELLLSGRRAQAQVTLDNARRIPVFSNIQIDGK